MRSIEDIAQEKVMDDTTMRSALKAARDALKDCRASGRLDTQAWHGATAAIAAADAALAEQSAVALLSEDELIAAALRSRGCEQLREWCDIGPVQRAAVEAFFDGLVVAITSGGRKY